MSQLTDSMLLEIARNGFYFRVSRSIAHITPSSTTFVAIDFVEKRILLAFYVKEPYRESCVIDHEFPFDEYGSTWSMRSEDLL